MTISSELTKERFQSKKYTTILFNRRMIQQCGSKNWLTIIDTLLDISYVSTRPLASFFEPLEEFIEEYQEDFTYEYKSSKGKELEELRNKVIQGINNPITTTIKPTTIFAQIQMKQNESLTSDSSLSVPENIQDKRNSSSQSITSTKDYLETLKTIETESSKPNTNKSKAAWAVGAVLIAIVIICTIAIFGQKRCRRTPKNRRYV